MCKHVAATLYGVGARLDTEPELFFRLRRVDQLDLLTAASSGAILAAQGGGTRKRIAETALAEVFGIELDESSRRAGAPPGAAPGDGGGQRRPPPGFHGDVPPPRSRSPRAVRPRRATPSARADRPVRSPGALRSRRRTTRG